MKRTTRVLLSIVAVLASTVSTAQLKPVDQGAAAIDANGLMWANTVGIELSWNPNGGPGTAQAWVANLNTTDYGGFNDWTLPTGNFNVAPNATTNQLGELFYADCGNVLGQQSRLTNPGSNCRALSALRPVMQSGMSAVAGANAGNILISSSTFLGPAGLTGYSWAVFDTENSSERYWDSDTTYGGIDGAGDVLAVRLAGIKPKESSVIFAPRSVPEPGMLALLGIGMLGLGLRRWGDRRKLVR